MLVQDPSSNKILKFKHKDHNVVTMLHVTFLDITLMLNRTNYQLGSFPHSILEIVCEILSLPLLIWRIVSTILYDM